MVRAHKRRKVMKRNRAFGFLLASLMGVLVLPIPFRDSNVVAQTGRCSLQTLKGTYAARISGWVGPGAGRVPYSDVGFVRLDGRGNLAGASTFSLDGVIGTHDILGTYTVDPDTCTGDAVTTIGTFFFVIADNGRQTRIISTTHGATVDGEAIRQ
jgi:hypothetical protein